MCTAAEILNMLALLAFAIGVAGFLYHAAKRL